MIEQLFGSKTRVKLLQLFFSNPNRSFYVREITRKIDEQINSVRRELSNLLSIGIIVSDTTNNKLYYEVNQSFEYYAPLRQIFGNVTPQPQDGSDAGNDAAAASVVNAPSENNVEAVGLKSIGHIELAVLTGQFTRDDTSGVDFFVVGEVNPNALNKYVSDLELKEGKSLRYTKMSLEDFIYRQQIRDRFAVGIMNSKKQILVDNYNLLGEKSEADAAEANDKKDKRKK